MQDDPTLFEVAFMCRLYGALTNYDRGLNDMRDVTDNMLDPDNSSHRAALFLWLNQWGCRQFAKAHHETVATDSLLEWAERWIDKLPPPSVQLTDLSEPELEELRMVYGDLVSRLASYRTLRDGRQSKVTYGPVGTAKTLFAIRPNLFPPWDNPIMRDLGYGFGRANDYLRYLKDVATLLRQLAEQAEATVSEIPSLVSRPDSSAVKVIDEYNWVKVTRRFLPPTVDELKRWLEWANRDSTSGLTKA